MPCCVPAAFDMLMSKALPALPQCKASGSRAKKPPFTFFLHSPVTLAWQNKGNGKYVEGTTWPNRGVSLIGV